MFQTIWFFLKIFIIIAFLAWIISLSGTVSIDLFDYSIMAPTNIFFLFITILLFLCIFLYKVLHGIFSIPQKFSRYRETTRYQKGYDAMTRGLVAVAAGDAKQATYFARRSKNLLPLMRGKQQPLHLLLEAQAARLRGEDSVAQNRFEALMEDKDAAFLGIRGLLASSIEKGDDHLALQYANQAASLHPNQAWVIQILYHLQIKNKMWDAVLETAKKAKKYNALELEKIMSDEAAIYLMRFDNAFKDKEYSEAEKYLKQALKIDKNFIPTTLKSAKFYLSQGKYKKSSSIIKNAWRHKPHPDLATIWLDLAPEAGKFDEKRLKWIKTLASLKPDHIESHLLLARAAMDMELWGDAKASLVQAEKIHPSAQLYRMMAIVEQNSTHNEDSIHTLMGKASEALPDKVWICSQTGIIYEEWMPIAPPHESFNTIIWQYASAARIYETQDFISKNGHSNLLIDPI